MMEIRPAKEQEFEAVRSFYHTLIDLMENAQYKPCWKKDIYPSKTDLLDALQEQTLYLGLLDSTIIASMVFNHACNEDYSQVRWHVDAAPDEISVIHMLGVLPTYSGKGYAKEMVQAALSMAKQHRQKAVRLDVLSGNLPAEKLYTSMGFQYIDTVQMYYEDTGRVDFMLYEYSLI